MNDKILKALNSQINWELYSSYFYLSMSAYFDSINLKGFANWMRIQVQEEIVHSMKFYDYIVKNNGRVILSSIEKPPFEWKSPLEVFEHTYQHEQKVTGLINNLVSLAESEKDADTKSFLNWFVKEQVEEEESADEIVKKIGAVGDSKEKLSALDNELNKRTFTYPVKLKTA
jgi:ferritin